MGGYALQFARFVPPGLLESISTNKRERVFTQLVVFWAWMSQVLACNRSCDAAVSKVQAWRLADKLPSISSKTTAYCKARLRLPMEFINSVSIHVNRVLNRRIHKDQLWQGMKIMSVDGSSVQLMDTQENQKEFPQPSNQKEGCGFPVMKFLGLLNHSTGAWEHHLTAHPDEHDSKTMRRMIDFFKEPCLLLADRAFCSFEIIHRLSLRGVHSVMRLHQMRAKGFTLRKGKRIGPNERLVVWVKPRKKPKSCDLSDDQWEALDDKIHMRVIACWYEDRNGEKKRMLLATTLLDPCEYEWIEIVNLYATRWDIELRLRDVKTTLGMEMLNVQSPFMARKALAMALLGFNLVKAVAQEAALECDVDQKELSFSGLLEWIGSSSSLFREAAQKSRKAVEALYEAFLEIAATKQIDVRPYRWEPRMIKKRPKPFPRMSEPRNELKRKHLAGELAPALS